MTDTDLLQTVINKAKEFKYSADVLMAISIHPEWLTIIPEDRRWAILHQVIFSGDVIYLNQLLALQKSNKKFRLLTNTRDNKTVLDIASLRRDTLDMKNHIQQLIKLDEMLTYARECKWDQCYDIIKENPNYVNEKPPYRRFYVIHHMACANAIQEFERFTKIQNCTFDLTLQADRKKANAIAREYENLEFAKWIEERYSNLLDIDSTHEDSYRPSEEAKKQTSTINAVLQQKNIMKELDKNLMRGAKMKTRNEAMQEAAALKSQYESEKKQKNDQMLKTEETKGQELVLDNLQCPLTLVTFIEPGKV